MCSNGCLASREVSVSPRGIELELETVSAQRHTCFHRGPSALSVYQNTLQRCSLSCPQFDNLVVTSHNRTIAKNLPGSYISRHVVLQRKDRLSCLLSCAGCSDSLHDAWASQPISTSNQPVHRGRLHRGGPCRGPQVWSQPQCSQPHALCHHDRLLQWRRSGCCLLRHG